MLKYCKKHKGLTWLGRILTALTYTGMRISEVASLRVSDIHYETNTIRLTDERNSQAARKRGHARELKGKRSRSFPIHAELLPVLRAIPAAGDGLVFHGPLGGRIKPDVVRNCLKREVLTKLKDRFPTPAGEARGFIDGRLHSFRHFFCSMCANSGKVSEQALMQWLGHRSSLMVKH